MSTNKSFAMKRVSTFLAVWLCAATAIFANLPTVEQRTYEAEEAPSEISYTIDKANGNLYRGTAANQNWNSTWKSMRLRNCSLAADPII